MRWQARMASLSVRPRMVKRLGRPIGREGCESLFRVRHGGRDEPVEVLPTPVDLDLEITGAATDSAGKLGGDAPAEMLERVFRGIPGRKHGGGAAPGMGVGGARGGAGGGGRADPPLGGLRTAR